MAPSFSPTDRFVVRYESAQANAYTNSLLKRCNRLRQHSETLLARSRTSRSASDAIHEKIRSYYLRFIA